MLKTNYGVKAFTVIFYNLLIDGISNESSSSRHLKIDEFSDKYTFHGLTKNKSAKKTNFKRLVDKNNENTD